MHHLGSWVKRDQLNVTCFIISLFNAQHVSGVNTFILRSLRLICWVISWVELIWFDVCWCYVVVWLWWCGIRMQSEALVPQPAYGYGCGYPWTTDRPFARTFSRQHTTLIRDRHSCTRRDCNPNPKKRATETNIAILQYLWIRHTRK